MSRSTRAVASPRRGTVRRPPLVEAPAEAEAGSERARGTRDRVALHPSIRFDARVVSRLSPDQRVGIIQDLQRSYGNARVARMIAAGSLATFGAGSGRQGSERHLQRVAGGGVGAVASAVADLGQLIVEAQRLLNAALQDGEALRENRLTDELFWIEFPKLRGQKLPAGSPEVHRWLQIRDEVVRPLLRTFARGGHPGGPATATAPAASPAADLTPAAQVAADSAKGDEANAGSKAGEGDKYFTQDVGHYQDTTDAGKARIWLYGSSGANVCNMTSLTMSLVSMAGEPELRAKLIALLRTRGMHAGASVQIGWTKVGKKYERNFVPLADALDNPKVVDKIETIDLVTAVAIGVHGGYGDVTEAATIARVAEETGLAKAKEATGDVYLTNPKTLEAAAAMLAAGKRVIAGTVNHYVYLVEVRGDGVVVHDPAGARVTPGLDGMLFLHNGEVGSIAREFLKMDPGRRATALRRVSTNAAAAAVVNELPRIADLPEKDQVAALRDLARAHPEHITTGASNFYATGEFAANKLRLRVTLSAAH